MAGHIGYEEFGQRASMLLPNASTFQYSRTHVKNLALPVSKLKPMKKLFEPSHF